MNSGKMKLHDCVNQLNKSLPSWEREMLVSEICFEVGTRVIAPFYVRVLDNVILLFAAFFSEIVARWISILDEKEVNV